MLAPHVAVHVARVRSLVRTPPARSESALSGDGLHTAHTRVVQRHYTQTDGVISASAAKWRAHTAVIACSGPIQPVPCNTTYCGIQVVYSTTRHPRPRGESSRHGEVRDGGQERERARLRQLGSKAEPRTLQVLTPVLSRFPLESPTVHLYMHTTLTDTAKQSREVSEPDTMKQRRGQNGFCD